MGGAPHVLVLDNPGEGVLRPDIDDPAINPLYHDLLARYGAVATTCRVRGHGTLRPGLLETAVLLSQFMAGFGVTAEGLPGRYAKA
jgi:hypothetical protein